jgi:hypothetical protein
MLRPRALAPDGTEVAGFSFEGALSVVYEGAEPVDAGIRVELELQPTDEPAWLVPGVFYGENRPEHCTRIYPRYVPGALAVERMEADAWSFRADRCATPAVFARGGGLRTSETSPVGQSGVGFALRGDRPVVWLDFPYREEPLRYDGSETPAPPDVQTYRWAPGERLELDVRVCDGDRRRELRRASGSEPLGPWVSVEDAATLAAWGLWRWHYRPEPARLLETVSFDREQPDDRDHMHVSWVSGVPYAYALLRHGLRVGNADYAEAGAAVLDHVAANLTPGGTFWSQWTAERGWQWGWHPDHSRLHARTLADAALFLGRAAALRGSEPPSRERRSLWAGAVRANLDVVCRTQREDGALPAAHHVETGAAVDWEGTAGLAWIPALVEAGRLDEARRAGAYFRGFEQWYGAPEDVDLAPTSEDGYAAVMAFVALEDWEAACRAADWMLTFRYTYDVAFDPDTTLGRHRFRTRGGDQASPANQHLHAFGLVCLPEMARLADATGDTYYLDTTRENLACFRQFVARHDGDFGAMRGMTSERYYQTDVFAPKGGLLPLSHAWTGGLLLHACEAVLADHPELL